MEALCGVDCCSKCDQKEACGGCRKNEGHPFGGTCIAAEAIKKGGMEAFLKSKNAVIEEVNKLGIDGLQIADLNLLNGFFVNLEYTLKNGEKIKLLEDKNIYWGNQVEKHDGKRCYGVVADEKNILVCEYECNGANPEIVVYKRR